MLTELYFYIFNSNINPYTKLNLMGIIAFYKSFLKHYKRKSPRWMILLQVKGIVMCLKQLFKEG